MELSIHCYAYALLALAHAESTCKLYAIAQAIGCDQILKLLYDLAGTLEVAGTTDTNCDFHYFFLLICGEHHLSKRAGIPALFHCI